VPISSDPVIAPTILGAEIFKGTNGKYGLMAIFMSDDVSPAPAFDSANYKLIELQSDGTTITARPVTVFPQYHHEVKLIVLVWAGNLVFPLGGHLTVSGTPPSGISSRKGVFLDGAHNGTPGTDANLSILPGGSKVVVE
jgi:hypothetical protein